MVTSVCDQIRRVFYLTVSVVLARQGLQLSLLSMSEECGLAKSGVVYEYFEESSITRRHVSILQTEYNVPSRPGTAVFTPFYLNFS